MSGKTGIGTIFQKKISGAYESIANMLNISGPGSSRDTVDSTVMEDEDGFRNFITGLRDGGTLSFDMLFTQDGYNAMLADFNNDDAQSYAIFFAKQGEGAVLFNGLVTDLPLDIPINDVIKCSVTIKVTGAIDVPADGPYLVSYNKNGADSGTLPANQTKEQAVALALRSNTGTLALTASTFSGWNTAAAGSGTHYDEAESYTANAILVLYAEWT